MSADYKRYLFEYRHEGAEWAFEVVASSRQDAQERLRALAWAHYRGEIQAKVGLPGGNFIFDILRKGLKRINRFFGNSG